MGKRRRDPRATLIRLVAAVLAWAILELATRTGLLVRERDDAFDWGGRAASYAECSRAGRFCSDNRNTLGPTCPLDARVCADLLDDAERGVWTARPWIRQGSVLAAAVVLLAALSASGAGRRRLRSAWPSAVVGFGCAAAVWGASWGVLRLAEEAHLLELLPVDALGRILLRSPVLAVVSATWSCARRAGAHATAAFVAAALGGSLGTLAAAAALEWTRRFTEPLELIVFLTLVASVLSMAAGAAAATVLEVSDADRARARAGAG